MKLKFDTKRKKKTDKGSDFYEVEKTIKVIPSDIQKAIASNQKVIEVYTKKNIELQTLYENITA